MAAEIYLDNSATTKPRPEVVRKVCQVMDEEYGNPSSIHRLGVRAELVVKESRALIARALSVMPQEIVFTSGGTEANNLALFGAARAMQRAGRHLITTKVEHPSVLKAFELLEEEGYEATYLGVDRNGLLDVVSLREAIREDTILVSIMHVNNETGAIQPLAEVGRVLAGVRASRSRGRPLLWHVDAVQGFTKVPLAPRDVGIDLMSLSGHKLHGPKGSGALYVRQGVQLRPLVVGGGQERGLRSGTENVPGIAGFGEAVRIAVLEMEEAVPRMRELRSRLIRGIMDAVPDAVLNGSADDILAAPHIVNLSFPGVKGEVLVHALEERGVYVSTGAACSSRRAQPSHVLTAMGIPPSYIEGAIRISLSPLTTRSDIDSAVTAITNAVADLRAFSKR